MIKKIKSFKKDELLKGSLILFFMINIFNFLNYLFHFSMARMLGPADYGVLAVLMSVAYIFGISSEAIQNIISRYTSKINLKKEFGKMKNLLKRSLKKGFKISLLFFIVYLPFAFLLSIFLKISFWLFVLTGVLIFSDLLAPIPRGMMQGIKKFSKLGLNMIVEGAIKLILAIFLVYIGLRVYGAITAVTLSVFASIILALFFLKDIIKSEEEKFEVKKIYSYSVSFFIAIISITLMFSLDIIIARRFFSPEVVGKYAVASMLGKMIFFGTSAISKAMFPFTSEGFENKKKTRPLFYKSALFLSMLCLIAIIAFAIFPKLIITILFGKQYLAISGILIFMGIAFSILALTNLIVMYALSKDKCAFTYYLPIFVIIEITLLIIFNSTLLQYSLALLLSNLLMLMEVLILIKNESKYNNSGT